MSDHSDSLHNVLQQHMMSVEAKLANLRAEWRHTTPLRESSSSFVSGSLQPDSSGGKYAPNQAFRAFKLKVPRFDGSDPNGWLFRVEAFFDYHDTPDDLCLQIVSLHLEGRATTWFQWSSRNNLLSSWPEFVTTVCHRFRPAIFEDFEGNLSKLTQNGLVSDFQVAFEDLMNKVTGIFEPLLISFFITGLKPAIRRELLFNRPSSLMEAFALARAYEARKEDGWTSGFFGPRRSQPSLAHTTNPTRLPTSQLPFSSTEKKAPDLVAASTLNPPVSNIKLPSLLPTPPLPILRLSPLELREKREKGLCYNCDQKYTPTHHCRSRYLLLLGTDDDDEQLIESDLADSHPDEDIPGDISSLNALMGHPYARALRLEGSFGDHRFHVLIDSGSTHNFIKPAIVEQLQLPVSGTPRFRVFIGNGDFLLCTQRCSFVPIALQRL